MLVQSEARSQKRTAVLANPITRNRSLQRNTCDFYSESGIHEDWRGFGLKKTSISKITARCTHAKFAIWTLGSSLSRREKIHRASKRTKRAVQENLSLTFRGHVASIPEKVSDGSTERRLVSQGNVKRLIQQFVNQPNRDSLNRGFEEDCGVQSVQREVEGVDQQQYFELCETSS